MEIINSEKFQMWCSKPDVNSFAYPSDFKLLSNEFSPSCPNKKDIYPKGLESAYKYGNFQLRSRIFLS